MGSDSNSAAPQGSTPPSDASTPPQMTTRVRGRVGRISGADFFHVRIEGERGTGGRGGRGGQQGGDGGRGAGPQMPAEHAERFREGVIGRSITNILKPENNLTFSRGDGRRRGEERRRRRSQWGE
ncbi:hypothetical protein K438DRAFT_1779931 [Mycena galopus ATCC 62051]|nr:hypothetical protein K438DRAFT_1779931 [Mycena galopus ATCC 62051]